MSPGQYFLSVGLVSVVFGCRTLIGLVHATNLCFRFVRTNHLHDIVGLKKSKSVLKLSSSGIIQKKTDFNFYLSLME
jgi:hypothetical protein